MSLGIWSVNWHLWPSCNYSCVFCFATFPELKGLKKRYLTKNEGKRLLLLLKRHGTEKITFVGGEPLLCPWLGEYVSYAKSLGLITTIVTNGSLLKDEFLNKYGEFIDWIGLSIDSSSDVVERKLGRGKGDHLRNIIKLVPKIKELGIRIKINVTITKAILQEDLHKIINQLNPDRLKFFQVLEIEGENDGKIENLLIDEAEFQEFIKRHADLNPIGENNDIMRGSYVMIDPLGRFFDSTRGHYIYSDPITKVGVETAFQQITFEQPKFFLRGGMYFREYTD